MDYINPAKKLDDIKDFEIDWENPINYGAYGLVYLGKVTTTGQKIAVKTSKPNVDFSAEAMIQEYDMLLQCNHPSIIYLIGLYYKEESRTYNLLTPYLEKSLRNLLDNNSLDNTIILYILYGIINGMIYLHNKNICHRDLKPDNIMIDENNYPILIDFGIARNYEDDMSTNNIGTIYYMAPELSEGKNYDQSIDVYSFGIIMNELFSDVDKMKKNKAKKKVEICPDMPDEFKEIVKKCIDSNPSNRPSFETILKDFNSFLANDEKVYDYDSRAFDNYKDYLKIKKEQTQFFRIPKQIVKIKDEILRKKDSKVNIKNVNLRDLVDWEILKGLLELNDPNQREQKVVFFLFSGPHGKGKTETIRFMTGNIAQLSGEGLTGQTKGFFADGPYYLNDLQRFIISGEYRNMMNKLTKLTNDIKIFFIDSQGFSDEEYEYNKEILDKIISIFCSVSIANISLMLISDDPYMKIVFKLCRGILFSSSGKQYLCIIGHPKIKKFTSGFSFNKMKMLQDLFNEESHKKEIFKFYNKKFVKVIGLGYSVDGFKNYYATLWYLLYTILFDINENADNIYKSQEIYDQLDNLFKKFNEDFNKYENMLMTTDHKKIIDLISNENLYLYTFNCISNMLMDNLNEIQSDFDVKNFFAGYDQQIYLHVKVFFTYLIAQRDFTYNDFIQYIFNLDDDLKALILHKIQEIEGQQKSLKEIQKIINENQYYVYATSAISMVSSFGARRIIRPKKTFLISVFAVSLLTYASKYYYDRKPIKIDIKNTSKYCYYKYIWENFDEKLIMKNYIISAANLVYENKNKKPNEINNNDVDESVEINEIYTLDDIHYRIYEEKTDTNEKKQKNEEQVNVPTLFLNHFENYQVIIFFEQNMNIDSTPLIRALTGMDIINSNGSQIKISKAININLLMDRLKINNFVPKSNIKCENILFLYLKGCDKNVLIHINDRCRIKPIFVSSLKFDDKLLIMPDEMNYFYLFYLSKTYYELIINEINNGNDDESFYLRNDYDYQKILNFHLNTRKKEALNIPQATLLPVNSDYYNFRDAGPITNMLVKFWCMHILRISHNTQEQ